MFQACDAAAGEPAPPSDPAGGLGGSVTSSQHRRADRAAEVAERGHAQSRRPVVGEQMREHRVPDAVDVGLAQPDPEPAATAVSSNLPNGCSAIVCIAPSSPAR